MVRLGVFSNINVEKMSTTVARMRMIPFLRVSSALPTLGNRPASSPALPPPRASNSLSPGRNCNPLLLELGARLSVLHFRRKFDDEQQPTPASPAPAAASSPGAGAGARDGPVHPGPDPAAVRPTRQGHPQRDRLHA